MVDNTINIGLVRGIEGCILKNDSIFKHIGLIILLVRNCKSSNNFLLKIELIYLNL